ncbi:AAA family ATPase [Nocardioides sp. MAH-18]|uniref:AAA family ATPase n=1 Tax=Nocardioides agri TaxID=2682843 RepID=A0A6L6XTK7_9ACTN|nr:MULTISPECIES: ATP-binding protein [unclassified Nocardioides]MBA2954123.1 ATP-binding protein [Nocardioides sp. CGMCC 1.13656]MVQ48985.1 AAA family ATPase [Nocardioides sp. MAH-18]
MTTTDRRSCLEVSREAALVALAGAPDAFADWWRWWEAQDGDASVRRLVAGFALSRPEAELVALLLAAAASEPVARAVSTAVDTEGGVGGAGLPLWLACRVVAGLDASALARSAPLLRLGLVEITEGAPRIETRMRLVDALVDRLLGDPVLDPVLTARMQLLPDAPPGMREPQQGDQDLAAVSTASRRLAEELSTALGTRGPLGVPPLVLARRSGTAELGRALRTLGLLPWSLAATSLPDDPDEIESLALRWSREAALDAIALVVHDDAVGSRPALGSFLDRVLGHVVLTAPQAPAELSRGVHVLTERPDGPDAMLLRWARELGPERTRRVGPALGPVAAHFRLDEPTVARTAATAGPAIDAAGDDTEMAAAALWHVAARAVTPVPRPGIRIVEPAYTWEDLVLQPETEATLRRVEAHVRFAARVLDDWGFAARLGGREGWRGRGVAALFAGPSGTGKTMAAEVIAASLDLRVMSIDLSQVISKFVGETSKNIAAAFDEAERSGAVMVWNEGDAVWGTRGGVGNAVDRHVNAEVGDLLQRIEEFSGFTLVTTNLRQAIDPAFLRRFRFVVDFPVPSEAERLRLWRSAFPAATPVEPLEWERLAGLPLTGGSIRNVALGAAFLAASAGTSVTRTMIEAELGQEMRKQDLPMPRLTWSEPS